MEATCAAATAAVRRTGRVLGTVVLAGCLGGSLVGCGHPAEKMVNGYLSQKDCKDRTQFILEPDKHRDALATYYRERNGCIEKHGKIDTSSCKTVAVGEYCTVPVESVASYCVKRTGDKEFKIDWPCSIGWNPMPMRVFKADRPELKAGVGVVMRVEAQLSDSFDSDVDREHHFAIRLSDGNDNSAFYMPMSRPLRGSKTTLELANGAELKKLLSDGKWHRVTVEVGYFLDVGKTTPLPWISWFVQDGWRSIPESDLTARREERSKALDKWLNPNREDEKKLTPCCEAMAKRGETEKDRTTTSKVDTNIRSFLWTSRSLDCRKDAIRVRQGDRSFKDVVDELKRQFEQGKGAGAYEDPPKECTDL